MYKCKQELKNRQQNFNNNVTEHKNMQYIDISKLSCKYVNCSWIKDVFKSSSYLKKI